MKRAPVIFFIGMVIFFTAMASTTRHWDKEISKKQSLDLTGIDSVEIVSNNITAQINMTDGEQPSIETHNLYPEESAQLIYFTMQKEANKLIITSRNTEGVNYGEVNLVLPSSIHVLKANTADINSRISLDQMEVHVGSRLSWSGAVKRLKVIEDSTACESNCASLFVAIARSNIDQLSIQAIEADITLSESDMIKSGELILGPVSSLNISPVGSLKNIQLKQFPLNNSAPSVIAK
jgi:hypothetical protein